MSDLPPSTPTSFLRTSTHNSSMRLGPVAIYNKSFITRTIFLARAGPFSHRKISQAGAFPGISVCWTKIFAGQNFRDSVLNI